MLVLAAKWVQNQIHQRREVVRGIFTSNELIFIVFWGIFDKEIMNSS